MLDLNDEKEVEIINKMHAFNKKNGGISWSYGHRNKDNVVVFVPMINRPCYGEMRAYGASSTRPKDYHPGDLPRPIPAGPGREAISVAFKKVSLDIETHNAMIEYMFSSESPWKRGIGYDGLSLTKDDKGRIKGVVMWDTAVDPTVMVALFMAIRSLGGTDGRADSWVWFQEDFGLSKFQALVATFYFPILRFRLPMYTPIKIDRDVFKNGVKFTSQFNNGYFLPNSPDFKKMLSGQSLDLSNGKTWQEGEDYNRPSLAEVFRTDDGINKNVSTELRSLYESKGFMRDTRSGYFDEKNFQEGLRTFVEYVENAAA